MIIINFKRIFKIKGINKPFTYLTSVGFSGNFASKVKNNRVRRLELKELEKLCLLLNCTPNDLYEWVPDDDIQVAEDHELHKIRKSDKVFDLTRAMNSLSLEDLGKVEDVLNETLKKSEEE